MVFQPNSMEKLKILRKVKELYNKGENLIQFLQNLDNSEINSVENIHISYDFQSGSYVKGYLTNPDYKNAYCKYLSNVLEDLEDYSSIVEVGIGEATTLGVLISKLDKKPEQILGFDISWSRIKYAFGFLKDLSIENSTLFTGDLFSVPLPDNSVDIVYTSHSIEPNAGKEFEALIELYRIAKKYLILLEPSYEFANDEARKRMLKNGYATNLYSTVKKLGYKIIEHRLFDISSNPLNPTGLIIIEKNIDNIIYNEAVLSCPITKTRLTKIDNVMYSKDSMLAYPIVQEIPCLLPENAIIATHFQNSYNDLKSSIVK